MWHTTAIVFLLTCATACGARVITRVTATGDARKIFKTQVYPLFAEMRCNDCHTSDSSNKLAQKIKFAEKGDIDIAYQYSEKKVSFSDIDNSRLITRQVPEGHRCNKASGECDSNVKKLKAALTLWQKSRSGSDSVEEFKYDTHKQDADQDEKGDYPRGHELGFSLDKLVNGESHLNILKVTAVKASNTLALGGFTLSTGNKPIYIKGLRAKRNGTLNSNNQYSRVCALVEARKKDQRLPQFGEFTFSLSDSDNSPNEIVLTMKEVRIATDSDKCTDK